MLTTALMPAVGAAGAMANPAPPPGVHIDPGSPVAKEYAIPLASARGGGGSGAGPLFGKGITRTSSPPPRAPAPSPAPAPTRSVPAASSVPAPSATPQVAPTRRRHRRRPPRAPLPSPPANVHAGQVAAVPAAAPSAQVRPAGAGTGIAWMVGVAVLVLAVGGMGGAVLARHGRRTSAHTS